MYDIETVEYAKTQENIVKHLEYRVHNCGDNRSTNRNTLMRDYARVLYSSSFRRLQGKMQLLGIDANKFNRNRLTHSLEVAQIARSIALDLGLDSTVVAETASLAHDIGNPPFGHYGEKVLNGLAKEVGGYEGNAQAFRILRTLELKHPSYAGLDLNVRTLIGTVKYFQNKSTNQDKFLYDEDYTFLQNELDKKNIRITKSIDAEIMDLSDEIAYAAHDLEDALSFGMISLDEIVHEFKISEQYSSAHGKIVNITEEARKTATQAHRTRSSEEYAVILKKELTSIIVNMLCNDISLINGCLGYKNHKDLAEGLKKLLFKAILRKKDVQLYELRGKKIIKGLFQVYTDESYNQKNILLPPELREINEPKERIVTDYISGMMDSFATQEYEKYFGKGSLEQYY